MRNALVLFLSAVLVLVAGSAWIVLYPRVPMDLGGVEDLDARATHVRIPVGDDDHLDGWYLRGRQRGTVILFAGFARDHHRVWRYAHFLHALGLHVLAVDFRSVRAAKRKPTTLGFWELADARAALDWVRAQNSLRDQPVALFGESLGGVVALKLASERPDVAAVVADCPFASADAAISDGFRYVVRVPPYPLDVLSRQVGRLVTGHDPGSLDATEALRSMNGRPVLLIQTRRADRFSRDQVERLTRSAGLRAETWTVDDARHTEVWVARREEYEKKVSRFLAATLGLEPPEGRPGVAERAARGAKAAGKAVTNGAKAAGRAVAKPFKKPGS